jgi:beta-N-acetylhexosaminidase
MMQDALRDIQPYDAQRDSAAIYALWQETLGETWPITFTRFQQVLAGPEPEHFVVRDGTRVIGFVATLTGSRSVGRVGYLAALLVAPFAQGRGIGSALHDLALDRLRGRGVDLLQLGSVVPRFWCGLPANLSAARPFFARRGWEFARSVFDLVRDLRDYATPEKVQQRLAAERITFGFPSEENIAEVLAFEKQEFPHWVMHFERCAELGDYQDLLVACDETDHVVGTLVTCSPNSHPDRTDIIWQSLLGTEAGAMGAVGVAASERGRGIGIGIVARASEVLRERGVGNCYVDWVELTDFYAKLGYVKWREYFPSWREA